MDEMKLILLLLLLPGQDPKAFLEGESARDAEALVLTLEAGNIDAVATFFMNREKPYKERLAALKALRLLGKKGPKEYKRVYKTVKAFLSLEASRGHGMSALKKEEAEMLLQSIEWHADMKYEHAMYVLEHYVDTEINRMRRNRLPDRVRETSARLLGRYPKNSSSRDTLWDTLVERREADALRKACWDSLKTHMKERKEKLLAWKVDPRDAWLLKLQASLRNQ